MELKSVDELKRVAEIRGAPMSKQQRLLRWAELLEREPGRQLMSLMRVEYLAPEARAAAQVPNSALSVAFEDPVLRAEGLKSDRFGDAVGFFELSEDEVHRVVCYCHHEWQVDAGTIARVVRRLAAGGPEPAYGWRRIGEGLGITGW